MNLYRVIGVERRFGARSQPRPAGGEDGYDDRDRQPHRPTHLIDATGETGSALGATRHGEHFGFVTTTVNTMSEDDAVTGPEENA